MFKVDSTSCCSVRKRKHSSSKDDDHDFEEELNKPKRSKSYRGKNAKNLPKQPLLNTQEEEEVVCAPDLMLFMDQDDQVENLDDAVMEIPPPSAPPPPPLQAAPTVIPTFPTTNIRLATPLVLPKNNYLVQNPIRSALVLQNPPTTVVQNHDVTKKPVLVQNPASIIKVQGKQIVLNATMNNPITTQNITNLTTPVEKVSTHKITLKTPNQSLMPGLKYEWFDNAARNSVDIQTKLSSSISELSVQKGKATTMDDLAKIHNKFQEMLSKSINSMIQIRRTLRNDFLSSLNQLKFVKKTQERKEEDDDVVFVDSTKPLLAPPPQPPPLHYPKESDRPRGPYLKVRSVSQLLQVPSECITIPDDVIEKISENKREEDAKKLRDEQTKADEAVACDVSNDSNKENVENFTSEKGSKEESTSEEKEKEANSEEADKIALESVEITQQIQKAIFESKIEKLVNDNLKYNVKNISTKELKRMLSARVYMSKNYKPKVKTMKQQDDCCQDFEALLDSSVVLKGSASCSE